MRNWAFASIHGGRPTGAIPEAWSQAALLSTPCDVPVVRCGAGSHLAAVVRAAEARGVGFVVPVFARLDPGPRAVNDRRVGPLGRIEDDHVAATAEPTVPVGGSAGDDPAVVGDRAAEAVRSRDHYHIAALEYGSTLGLSIATSGGYTPATAKSPAPTTSTVPITTATSRRDTVARDRVIDPPSVAEKTQPIRCVVVPVSHSAQIGSPNA